MPVERNRAQARRLGLAGAKVTVSEHEGGHALTRDMLDGMCRWLDDLAVSDPSR